MSNDDKFYGGLRVGAAGASAPTGSGAATPPLTAARTVHVDSALGNDLGDGSAALPFATLARAWAERLTYGELRAKLVIQLHGVGPYTMPVMGASVCGNGGYFILQGDAAAEVIAFSGTLTGNLAGFVVGSSAGLGVDTYKGDCIKITSGVLTGARVMIVSHTDTALTLAYTDVWTTLGATANGDTYTISRPGTVINLVDPASGQQDAGCFDWAGMFGTYLPRHIISNVTLTKTSSGQFRMVRSAVALVGIKAGAVGLQVTEKSFCAMGTIINGSILGVGADSDTNLLTAWGCSSTGNVIVSGGSTLSGVQYRAGGMTVGSSSSTDELIVWGGRFDGATTLSGCWLETFGPGGYVDVRATITLSRLATYRVNNFAATWKFTVTAGDVFRVKEGSTLCIEGVTTKMSGGTSAAAGFAVNCAGGGRCWFQNCAPLLTGGTLNADLHTSNVTAANATLAANGNAVGNATDALLGEVLARVVA
jgi:hypothetical protein